MLLKMNILGSETTVHKSEGLYCIFRNAPSMYLPKTNSIFLLGLWHSLDVKRFGYNKLLALLLKQLQELSLRKVCWQWYMASLLVCMVLLLYFQWTTLALTHFLADRCNATFSYCHEMSSLCLSSVTCVYCGQMVSWIRMPLDTEVGLGPSDTVLDGDPAPPTQRGTAALPNFFGPCLLWPNGCMDQDAS